MNQRIALVLSAALTTFVLVVLAAVILATQFVQPVAAAEPASTTANQASMGLDPAAVQTLLDQRDAEYRQALDQANTQLQDAYTKQQDLQAQLDTLAQAQAQAKAMNAFLLLDPNTGQMYMVANPMGGSTERHNRNSLVP